MPYADPDRQRESVRASALRARKLRRDLVDDYKLSHGCKVCGYRRCAEALEFHHRNPEEKVLTVSGMIARTRPIEDIIAEIEKCDVLCANCHREQQYSGSITGNAPDC